MVIPDDETIRSFHNKWLTLEHKSSGLVKGSEIKKRYSKEASKEVLSNTWSICSKTVKGYMTKGETLLFEHFLGLKKQNVSINHLPSESKQLIEEIDSENSYKIKNFSSQLEIEKENYQRDNNHGQNDIINNNNMEDLERQVEQNNYIIQNLRNEVEVTRT